MATDIAGTAKSFLPNISGGAISTIAIVIVVAIVVVLIVGFLVFYLVQKLKFNKNIVIFSKVGGHYEVTGRDKAMVQRLGDGGDTVFYLKKHKKTLPTPTIQSGRNTYWFAIRQDGEWINIGLEDIDFAMKKVKAHFLDKEVRYARTALQGKLKERYQELNFWQKNAAMISGIVVIFIVGIVMFLILSKFVTISGSLTNAIAAQKEVMEAAKQIIAGLQALKSSGSIVPVG